MFPTADSENFELIPPLWREGDQKLISTVMQGLTDQGSIPSISLKASIIRHIKQVASLGRQLDLYPSLFKTQELGLGQKRNIDTLVDRLSSATPFTLDLMLPMRAVTGKTFLLARLNFMRLLTHVIRAELMEREDAEALLEEVHGEISRCVLARVCEELLMSVICRRDLPRETCKRAALGLSHLWEDRIHFPMREFFPILEATWEARRRILVTYGTLAGTAEIFDLMANGCDDEFVDYFTSEEVSDDAVMAFREFLFGLSIEELRELEEQYLAEGKASVSAISVSQALDPESLTVVAPNDVATHLYMFFMKRHLEATARDIGNLEGPKHTAEEYVLIEFLTRHDPSIFGEG